MGSLIWNWDKRRKTYVTRNLLKKHLQVIKKEVDNQKEFKQFVLKCVGIKEARLEIENSKNTKNFAFETLLPEEVWTIVLLSLTETDDLLSCSETSPLFYNILNKSKSQWLFGKIFPSLFNYLEHKEVLVCRSVCKTWCNGIEDFLENYFCHLGNWHRKFDEPYTGSCSQFNTSNSFYCDNYDYNFVYNFGIPFDPSSLQGHNNIREVLKSHSRNPFLGKALEIEFTEEEQRFNSSNKLEFYRIFADFGQHISHIKLFSKFSRLHISIQDYHCLLLRILKTCPSLKTLYCDYVTILNDAIVDKSNGQDYAGLYATIKRKNSFPQHPNLKYIYIKNHNNNFQPIMDYFVGAYSEQLKCFETCIWNDRFYQNLKWEHLQRLVITCFYDDDIVDTLKVIDAPCLKELGIRLEGCVPLFRRMIKMINVMNRFDRLERLELDLGAGFVGFWKEEIFKRESIWLLDCPKTISSLSVKFLQKGQIQSFDFLTYFPHLKRLTIEYSVYLENNGVDDGPDCMEEDVEASMETVQFSKYLWRYLLKYSNNFLLMYKSNIWEVIKGLEFLEVKTEVRQTGETKMCVLTRQGYEGFRKL